jgi:hypothetical protein
MKMVYEQNLTEFDAAMPEGNDRLNTQSFSAGHCIKYFGEWQAVQCQ